tara:strand:+ start:4024 stop:4386 length:363 start_codon:yes stop_codon:yes gene_type:complete
MDKATKEVATTFICNGVILLESLDDLKDTRIWSKELKYFGNRFIKELEKKVLPVEAKLFEKEEEIKIIQQIQDLYEDISRSIAEFNLENLIELKAFMSDLKEGKVIKVTDKQAEKLSNAK